MILLDHCVPRRYLALLTEWGYQAQISTVYLPADASDAQVIALVQKLDAVLLTFDLDFANLLEYPPKDYAGIVVLRDATEDEALLDQTLKVALNDLYREGLRGVLVIVSAERYRMRTS
jgi:predicted nuclease of predicted toxin-antitoxin system